MKNSNRFMEKIHWNVILSFWVFVLLLIVFRRYVFENYDFVNDVFLTDILRANIPAYKDCYRNVLQNHSLWSWNMGIGTSVFSHGDILTDPFNIVILLGNYSGIEQRIIWSVILKIVFAANFFYVYVQRFGVSPYAGMLASVMYAFSGGMMILGANLALGIIFVYAPLIFLGMENLIQHKKSILLVVMLTLTGINSYYFLFVIGILCVIYLLFRLWMNGEKKIIMPLLRLFISGGISVGLGAFSILPQLELALNSPRIAEATEYGLIKLLMPRLDTLIIFLTRGMANEIFGTYDQYVFNSRYHDYFIEAGFISIFYLVLIFQLFSKKFPYRKYAGVACTALILMLSMPGFDYLTNACKMITNRWYFFYDIIVCLMIAFALDFIVENGIDRTCLRYGLSMMALCFCIGIYLRYTGFDDYSQLSIVSKYLMSALPLIIAAVIIFVNFRENKRILFLAMVCIISLDIFNSYKGTFAGFDSVMEVEETKNYYDASFEMISDLRENDTRFYRINKDFDSVYTKSNIPSLNDAMVQDYFGLKNYNSLPNSQYIKFLTDSDIYNTIPSYAESLQSAGISPKQVNGQHLNYVGGCYDTRYELINYMSVKYYFTKTDGGGLPSYYQFLESRDGVSVYENTHYLPLATIKDGEIAYDDYIALPSESKDRVIQASTVLPVGSRTAVTVKDSLNDAEYAQKQTDFEFVHFTNDEITFNLQFAAAHGRFLSLSMPYDKDWHIAVDGNEIPTESINISLLGANVENVSPGIHEIRLWYSPSAFHKGIVISLLCLVAYVLICATRKLRENIERCYAKIIEVVQQRMDFVKWNMLLLVLLQIITFVILVTHERLKYVVNDDTVMVSLASGGYGEPTAKLLNLHVLIGGILKLMYSFFRSVNWNTVLYTLLYFASFISLDYVVSILLSKKERKFRFKTFYIDLVTWTVTVLMLKHFTFTVLAYSLLIGGLSLYVLNAYINLEKSKLIRILAVVQLILAALVRHDVMKTGMIFILLIAIYRFVFFKKEKKMLVLEILLFGLMSISYVSNGVLICTNAESKSAHEWGEIRSRAVDCPMVPYDEVMFQEKGISVASYYAMYNVFFYIPEAVSSEKFLKLEELNSVHNKYNLDIRSYANILKERIKYALHVTNYSDIYLTIFIVAIFVNLFFCDKWGRGYTALVALSTFALDMLYFIINRNLYRISMPTYVMGIIALCMVLCFFSHSKKWEIDRIWLHLSVAIWIAFIIIQGTELYATRDKWSENYPYSEGHAQVLRYMEEHNDTLYIAGDISTYSIGLNLNMWDNEAEKYRWNLIGNWDMYSKASNDLARSFDLDPYKVGYEAINAKNVRILTSVEPSFENANGIYIKNLYKEFYDIDITLVKEEDIVSIDLPDGSIETWAAYRIVTE